MIFYLIDCLPFICIKTGPTVVHMKQHINRLQTENWTQELIWENNPFRINTVAQWGLVHYHVKDWHYE